MQARVIRKFSFLWVVKLYCPYDPEDPFLTQVVDVVNSSLKSWNCPTEVSVGHPIDERKERYYLLQGDFFVTG